MKRLAPVVILVTAITATGLIPPPQPLKYQQYFQNILVGWEAPEELFPRPPKRLPDIGLLINWRIFKRDNDPEQIITSLPRPEFDQEETGEASYYHPLFQGRTTASGEVFDQGELTAAHKELDWGTLVKVINLENNQDVMVRINDRGPFVPGRIIDLSRAAARELDMIEDGVTSVKIKY